MLLRFLGFGGVGSVFLVCVAAVGGVGGLMLVVCLRGWCVVLVLVGFVAFVSLCFL